VIKSISFIVLTHFFQFKQLKILRQPGYLLFFKLNQHSAHGYDDLLLTFFAVFH